MKYYLKEKCKICRNFKDKSNCVYCKGKTIKKGADVTEFVETIFKSLDKLKVKYHLTSLEGTNVANAINNIIEKIKQILLKELIVE